MTGHQLLGFDDINLTVGFVQDLFNPLVPLKTVTL
jgi:hypothetical protein